MLNLKIIVGSTREGRASDLVLPWIETRAREHGSFEVDVLDLRDWPLPIFQETFATVVDPRDPVYSQPVVRSWNQAVATGDAFVFVTPEYNHSVPAVLKNAIDNVFVSFAFRNKVAAFVGYSGGVGAGIRAVEHLVHVCVEAEMVPLRSTVLIPNVGSAFAEDGSPTNPAASTAAGIMLDDLAWWGTLLHTARQGETLPPAAMRAMAAAGHGPSPSR